MENVLRMEFSALAENEAFARAAAAAFVMPADPTVEELTEIKTAVSEAVSNCVIHGYGNRGAGETLSECDSSAGEPSAAGPQSPETNAAAPQNPETNAGETFAAPTIVMECALENGNRFTVKIEDKGVGIEDVDKAMEPLFTTGNEEERSGMGFTVMQSFMDKIKVKSAKGEGTTVIMTKYLDVPGVR